MKENFLRLVRMGIGHGARTLSEPVDWHEIETFAVRQGLLRVVLDGLRRIADGADDADCADNADGADYADLIPYKKRLEWLGKVMLEEERYAMQRKASMEMASLFARNGIRTYVLKGMVVSECYPKPQHRVSSDVDCFLVNNSLEFRVS